jgi:hypothetical protein
MRYRVWGSALVLTLGLADFAWSQGTKDQARLIFTVSGGVVTGRHLWQVENQPIQVSPNAVDTLSLGRRIRSSIGIGFSGAYFRGEHLGVGVEGFLIGLGFEDNCRVVAAPSGSAATAAGCQSIQGTTKSASAVALSAGPILRTNSQSLISPYVRANVGLVFSNQSSIRTIARFPAQFGIGDRVIYADDHDSRVSPSLALGAGFTAAVGRGYQLRWEVRDNIVGVQRVTGPVPTSDFIPPHKNAYKHLFSLSIGFDVVLERRKGRRY